MMRWMPMTTMPPIWTTTVPRVVLIPPPTPNWSPWEPTTPVDPGKNKDYAINL